jgi:hypothetical protein
LHNQKSRYKKQIKLSKFIGTKDEFEDLSEVSGKSFEYEYPLKKKEEPVAIPEND